MPVKFFPVQSEEEFEYTYPYQFYIEAGSHDEIKECLDWCCLNATKDWSHIHVVEHVNMRPMEHNDQDYQELERFHNEGGPPAWDWLGHGAYRPYLRITFSSPSDASHFKLRFAGNG